MKTNPDLIGSEVRFEAPAREQNSGLAVSVPRWGVVLGLDSSFPSTAYRIAWTEDGEEFYSIIHCGSVEEAA